MTCRVFTASGEYLGRVIITDQDWQHNENWRKAALSAARRTFGADSSYHVVEDVTPEDLGYDVVS